MLGTLNYMAPEILLGMPYRGMSVDIFSCAVILFVMMTNAFPFNRAAPDDKLYVLLANNRADLFWRHQMKACNQNFSQELMDLLTCMLQLDPLHRPSIAEVLGHPWVHGPTPT